jgi:hypothetical protein
MDEARARALLRLAASAPPPDGGVDVELARRRGRRRLRSRRAGLGGISALATLAVVAIPLRVLGPGPGTPPPGTHASATASPRPAVAVTPPRRFNPLIPYVAFGWLPHGSVPAGGQLSAGLAYITAGRDWAADVFAAGRCRRLGGELHCTLGSGGYIFEVGPAAPRVNGHRAYWTAPPGRSLLWQYARDSWAELSPASRASAREILKVAATLRYHVATRPSIRFPVQLTAMSPAWHVAGMYFKYDAGVLRASQYELAGGVGSPAIAADPGPPMHCYFYPNGQSRHETINGYRVTVNYFPPQSGRSAEQQVCVPEADGLNLFYSTFGRAASPSAVALFAHHTRLLGTNPAAWTTQPLR